MATVHMKVHPEDLSQVPRSGEHIPEPAIMVIFGASGDLTKRKLLPALYHLDQAGLLPERFAIVGVARRALGNEFAADMREGIVEFGSVDKSASPRRARANATRRRGPVCSNATLARSTAGQASPAGPVVIPIVLKVPVVPAGGVTTLPFASR